MFQISKTASFVYNLYDVNSVGVLGPDAAKLMLEELYGESFLKEESRTRFACLLCQNASECDTVVNIRTNSKQSYKSSLTARAF